MKSPKIVLPFVCFCIFVALVSSSCGAGEGTNVSTPVPTSTPTPTIMPTATPEPSPVAITSAPTIAPTATPEPTSTKEKSFLWEVKSQQNTVYLLGSVHILKEEHYPLPDVMEQAFDDAEVVVFEIDLDLAETDTAMNMMLEKAMFTGGNTLQTSLSEETYTLLEEALIEVGGNIELLNSFEPWFVSMLLEDLKYMEMGFDIEYGVDTYFYDKAKDARKIILALETIEYQINLFDVFSTMDQEMLVLQTLADLEVVETEFDSLIDAWVSGDSTTTR
ncbi:TraB/GumN family protein [Chloroflexota bacterium]